MNTTDDPLVCALWREHPQHMLAARQHGRLVAMAIGLWPCGHPRTAENTQSVGKAGKRCRECRRKITRESEARKWANMSKQERDERNFKRRIAALHRDAEKHGLEELLTGDELIARAERKAA